MTGFSSGVRGASLGTANTWTALQRFNSGVTINGAQANGARLTITVPSAPTGVASQYDLFASCASSTVAFATSPQTGDVYGVRLGALTFTNPSAGTIANSATMKLDGPPVPSTNVTVTNLYTWWVATGVSRFGGGIVLDEGVNFNIGTTTGTKFGAGTNQKIGFFNATPIVQPGAIAAYTNTGVYATDAANIKTAIDGLRAALTNLGLTA